MTVDYDAGTMTINGTATNIETVNRYADILKFTEYKEVNGSSQRKLFQKLFCQISVFSQQMEDAQLMDCSLSLIRPF